MSFLDKAKGLIDKHDDKVDQAIEKGADALNKKTPGHSDKIDQAKDFLQEKTGDGDTQR